MRATRDSAGSYFDDRSSVYDGARRTSYGARTGFEPQPSVSGRPAQASQARAPRVEEEVRLSRSQLISKMVVTRTSGMSLGVVTQLWVDTRAWEVVALDLRPNLLYGELDCVLLSSLKQVGDVVLVEDERALEPQFSTFGLDAVVSADVVTETGDLLGRVRDLEFDPDSGAVTRFFFDALGLPLVPATVMSVYALGIEEVVGTAPERIIVRSGCEERIQQLTASLLQRLQLAEPPWEEALRSEAELGYYYNAQQQQQPMLAPPRGTRYGDAGWGGESGERERVGAADYAYSRERSYWRERASSADAGSWQQQQQQPAPQQPARVGIPLVRPATPAERRDADGRYGEAPTAAAAAAASRRIDEWLEPSAEGRRQQQPQQEAEEDELQYELADGPGAAAMGASAQGRARAGAAADGWGSYGAPAAGYAPEPTAGGAAARPAARRGFEPDEDLL